MDKKCDLCRQHSGYDAGIKKTLMRLVLTEAGCKQKRRMKMHVISAFLLSITSILAKKERKCDTHTTYTTKGSCER